MIKGAQNDEVLETSFSCSSVERLQGCLSLFVIREQILMLFSSQCGH